MVRSPRFEFQSGLDSALLPLPEAPSKDKVYQRRWREAPMAEKKLRFKVMLEGKEGSSVAWLNPPFDVPETFGTRARIAVCGTINGFPFGRR